MLIAETHTLIAAGPFPGSEAWRQILDAIKFSVKQAEWPISTHPLHKPGKFFVYPESGKKSGMGNGVVPIKLRPMACLSSAGWELEKRWEVGSKAPAHSPPFPGRRSAKGSRPGDIDAAKSFPEGLVVVEWETGNVSSSHRSLNKMALGLVQEKCIAGILVVPNMLLAQYLTDRIGNVEELRSYFPMWKALEPSIKNGVLELIVIQQDDVNTGVPKIPKGKDGRAKEGAEALLEL